MESGGRHLASSALAHTLRFQRVLLARSCLGPRHVRFAKMKRLRAYATTAHIALLQAKAQDKVHPCAPLEHMTLVVHLHLQCFWFTHVPMQVLFHQMRKKRKVRKVDSSCDMSRLG
eukprot:5219687-Amphidinium_carterae.1